MVRRPDIDPGPTIEFRGDSRIAPSAIRAFTGKTELDAEIDRLPLPPALGWLSLAIFGLRLYRRRVSSRLGHRCVYDPACSRYAELAFRKYGLVVGLRATVRRLLRCRPGAGGKDLP
ncbi:MAG: membrane protein insertion efficiency factor YidD [Myxococcota bacterium]